jgi:small subunit ribosomal protein S21
MRFFKPLLRQERPAEDMSRKSNISVYVSSNVERALKQLKKKIEREGVVRDMKRTVYFESPTQKRRKRLVRAIKQNLMRMINGRP